jgi:hypothetical protein
MTDIEKYEPNDGFDDAASENAGMLQGALLLCRDGHWTVGKDTPLPSDTKLVACGTGAAWVKWWQGKPVDHRDKKPGDKLAERFELGDLDKTLWEIGPDKEPRDPWSNTRYVYFFDLLKSGETYTFSTHSESGRRSVAKLADQISKMRRLRRNSSLSPLCEFGSRPFQTDYGRKMAPVFKIVRWFGEDGAPPQIGGNGGNSPPLIGNDNSSAKLAKRVEEIDAAVRRSRNDDMNDDVPF